MTWPLPGGGDRDRARAEWAAAWSTPEAMQTLALQHELAGRPVPPLAGTAAAPPMRPAAEIVALRKLAAGTVHHVYGPADEVAVIARVEAERAAMRAAMIEEANRTAAFLNSMPGRSRIYFGAEQWDPAE